MSRLLVFNLATDADDPLLGFTTVWLNRLAAHYEAVDVITMRAGRLAVADNVRVYSVGKERGWSEPRRAWEFTRLLRARLAEGRYIACFAHMMPLFAVLGAPLLKAYGVPVTLWYAHRSPHWTVRAAVPLVRRVVTSRPDTFPVPTRKLRVIGQGIDTGFFSPANRAEPHSPSPLSSLERGSDEASADDNGAVEARHALPLQYTPFPEGEGLGVRADAPELRAIVHVARLMPIKRQDTVIRAVAALPPFRAVLVGEVPPGQDRGYLEELQALANTLGVSDRVTFAGAQPAEGVRDAYRRAFAAVNLSPPGLFDKAALEAMACAVPTLVTNPAFDDVLAEDAALLRVDTADNAGALIERLRVLYAMTKADRTALGARLRERLIARHGIDAFIPRLIRVLETGEPA